MIKNSALLISLAAIAVAPSAASAQSFQTFYKSYLPKLAKAFESKDVKFFDEISTSDFTDKSPQGTADKKASMAQMKQQFGMAKKLVCKFKAISVKASGSKGTAVVWMRAEMVLNPGDGKDHSMSMEVTETENWVKTGSGWKVKSVVEGKPQHVTMDGKPAPAGAMGG